MATPEASLATPEASRPDKTAAVTVRPLGENAFSRWNEFVLRHPKATFFHQTGWMKVMERTYGYRPYYFYSERSSKMTGIAPAFLVSNWVTGRSLISLPFAVYGGVCASDSESEAALIARLEHVGQAEAVDYLEIRDRDGETRAGYHANERYATFTIPLSPDAQAVYAAFPKDIRYMIRKAEKAGLKMRRGLDQLDDFYGLMTVNLRRLGTPAFPKALFENLIKEYPGKVDLTVVYSGETPVSGGMSFFFRDWMQPYYIGSIEKAKGLAANNFLWWKLIELAVQNGCSVFDFGRSKIESGNFDFKKKWNPRIEPLSYQIRLIKRTEVPNFSHTNPKFEMVTNLWKKMPLGFTRVVGPRLVRWFP